MLKMTFRPKHKGDVSLLLGATGYQKVWEQEGEKILTKFKELTGLSVERRHITVLVVPGLESKPGYGRRHMKLAVRNFDHMRKVATLMHELAHRLMSTNDIYVKKMKSRYWWDYRHHQMINLFLYDAMEQLYGKQFADAEVEKDRNYASYYGKAWDWALSKTFAQRQDEFKRTVKRNKFVDDASGL